MEEKELPRCKMCGATVPIGKTLCWCCEHGPKLHDPFTNVEDEKKEEDAK